MAGSVRKRGTNGKWYYSFEASTVDGKRKRIERVGGRTKKEAEAALRIALTEYENAGQHFQPSATSFSDYLDYWFKNYVLINCKFNTQNAYRTIIENHLKPSLGNYKLKSLSPSVLQEFVNAKYLYGFSKNYLYGMINVLNSCMKYAVQPCQFIKTSPMEYVKSPKYDHSKEDDTLKIITTKNFNKILERFNIETNFYMILVLGYYTGARIGEVTALTWDDIDLVNGTINIDKILSKRKKEWFFGSTKTKSSVRTIHISKSLIVILKQHKKRQSENRLRYGEYYIQQYLKKDRVYSLSLDVSTSVVDPAINFVCTKENGQVVTFETFKYAARVIHYELGLDFNYHSLRHTHATMLIESGANIKDVQERLGHSKLATTMDTYTHVTEKMAQSTADLFDKIAKMPTK